MTGLAEAHLSQFIWQTRYRDTDAQPAESAIGDTWTRVARAVAAIEHDPAHCASFHALTVHARSSGPGACCDTDRESD